MSAVAPWTAVCAEGPEDGRGARAAEPRLSVALPAARARPGAAVGVGATRLLDHLPEAGGVAVAARDIAGEGPERAQLRRGTRAAAIERGVGEATASVPPRRSGPRRDRAAFRVPVASGPRAARAARATRAAGPDPAPAPGADAIIGTFAADGPQACCGLSLRRDTGAARAAEIGARVPGAVAPPESPQSAPVTPTGGGRRFRSFLLRKAG